MAIGHHRVRTLRALALSLLATALVAAGFAVFAAGEAMAAGGTGGGTSGGAGLGGTASSGSGGQGGAGSQSGSGGAGLGGSGGSTGSSKSSTPSTKGSTSSQSHSSDHPASHQTTGAASGQVVGLSWASFTVQTGGRRMQVVPALTAAANALNTDNYPYVWAGGHPAAGAASVGTRGPGYTGHTIGFDCSGSVAAVLSAAGLWQPGTPVPGDSGVIAQLRQEGLIARGVGRGASSVTLYDDPGVHIFMNIGGRFFGTGANATGGPGWLTYSGVTRAFKPWHFVPSALGGMTSYGPELTFGLGKDPGLMYGLSVGQRVQVRYETARDGALTATAVTG
jgi:hypothetical protein